jgi:hypothetical protein
MSRSNVIACRHRFATAALGIKDALWNQRLRLSVDTLSFITTMIDSIRQARGFQGLVRNLCPPLTNPQQVIFGGA